MSAPDPRSNLLSELRRRPLLCDGAMGTQLMAAGLGPGQCGMLWNVERPSAVREVHQRYREAGCELITTNSFQGSRQALAMHALADRVVELNRAAAANARQAAGREAWVLADVGPFGGFLEPLGTTTHAELEAMFREQLAALHEGGAHAVIIETMSDPAEAVVAVQSAKKTTDWPVIATYAFQESAKACARPTPLFRTMMGATVAEAMHAAIEAGADVVGANCGSDLDLEAYRRLAEAVLAAAGSIPVIVQPNAGAPRLEDGCTVHPATPVEMSQLARSLLSLGVRIVGGCCGTTPAHLAAMAQEVKAAGGPAPR